MVFRGTDDVVRGVVQTVVIRRVCSVGFRRFRKRGKGDSTASDSAGHPLRFPSFSPGWENGITESFALPPGGGGRVFSVRRRFTRLESIECLPVGRLACTRDRRRVV